MLLTRRQAIGSFLALSAAATSMGLKSAAANEVGKYALTTDVSTPPVRRPKIFNAMEIMVGDPVKILPKSQVLKEVVKTTLGSIKAGIARRVIKDRHNRYVIWKDMLDEAGYHPVITQLAIINEFINTAPYVPDIKGVGKRDQWLAPEVFLDKGGDCEDFAIAKMASLKALGFHADRLRLVIVDDQNSAQKHAVLAVFLGGDIYILDNQLRKVVSQDTITHYDPICSMTNACLWMHMKSGRSKSALSRFKDLS